MSHDDLWREILADTGLLEKRPDFRFDPDFYGDCYPDVVASSMDLRTHFERFGMAEGRVGNAYQGMRAHLHELDKHLSDITTDARLRAAIEAGAEDIFELIFELLSLGDPIDKRISHFSERQYLLAHPDVEKAGLVALHHFVQHGITEGRHSLRDIRENQFKGYQEFDTAKPTCAICIHELSRTGAPLVGLDMARSAATTHNVIIMALRSGTLMEEFQKVAVTVVVSSSPDKELDYFNIPGIATFDFAILNSVESFLFAAVFVRHSVPFVSYLHEYSNYTYPTYKFTSLAVFSDLLVFSARTVRDSWAHILADIDFDSDRDSIIMPQAEISFQSVRATEFKDARAHVSRILGIDCSNFRIIYGAGHAQWRKGTDLFALTAQIARERDPEALFIWVGDGLNHEDVNFGVWLEKHLQEAGINTPQGNLFFLPAGEYYQDICRAADALFLPSRLDPLPNVVFDAARFDCQVVLFENATGFDDKSYTSFEKIKAVPYGDLGAACDALLSTPRKSPVRSWQLQLRSTKTRPDVFAKIAGSLHERLVAQRSLVAGSGEYDCTMLFSTREEDREARQREREKMWSYNRPWIWQSRAHAEAALATSDNWMHQNSRVERFASCNTMPAIGYSVHIHAHYLENLDGDLRYYRALREARRIVVTTDTTEKAERVAQCGKRAGVELETLVVPNLGRDILPFMKLFSNGHAKDDEIWCHIHQKKSVRVSLSGETWRRFLMTILLGDDSRLSSALEHIAAPNTGLVCALDPHNVNWAGSRRLLPQIAPKLPGPIPKRALLFPVGNMFWTRGRVVAQMNGIFGANYPWPNEPIANDGTVFHLIERLWPAASVMAGLNAVFLDKPDQKRV